MQRMFAILVDDRMPCIVSALKADDDVGILRQIIDNAPFAFIAPLSTYDRGHSHGGLSCLACGLSQRFCATQEYQKRLFGRLSTINRQNRSGYEARLVGTKKGSRMSNILGLADHAKRN